MTTQLEIRVRKSISSRVTWQQAVQELERRRNLLNRAGKYSHGVCRSIPMEYSRANFAVIELFGASARMRARSKSFSRGRRAGYPLSIPAGASYRVVSRELEIMPAGRLMHAAVTVSALVRVAPIQVSFLFWTTSRAPPARKSRAWQEVARRIAHEIKNPLRQFSFRRNGFPVSRKAQRVRRLYSRRSGTYPPGSGIVAPYRT